MRQAAPLFELRRVHARERAEAAGGGARYALGAWLANVFGDLHVNAALTLCYALVLYLATGLYAYGASDGKDDDAHGGTLSALGDARDRSARAWREFGWYYLLVLLCWLGASATVQLCAALVDSAEQCVPLFILVAYYVTFFSGFPILLSQLPSWWHWATYPDFFRWALQGLFRNAFDGADEVEGYGPILRLYSFDGTSKAACAAICAGIIAAVSLAQLAVLLARKFEARPHD